MAGPHDYLQLVPFINEENEINHAMGVAKCSMGIAQRVSVATLRKSENIGHCVKFFAIIFKVVTLTHCD